MLEIFPVNTAAQSMSLQQSGPYWDAIWVMRTCYPFLLAAFILILIIIGLIMLIKYRKCSIDKISFFAMGFYIVDFIIKSIYSYANETNSIMTYNSMFFYFVWIVFPLSNAVSWILLQLFIYEIKRK